MHTPHTILPMFITLASALLTVPTWAGPCGDVAEPCNVPHDTPGCSDVECCEQVCAVDLFCCDVAWDAICVELAGDLCTSVPFDVEIRQLSFRGDDGAIIAPNTDHAQLMITMPEPPPGVLQYVNAVINNFWAVRNAPVMHVDGEGEMSTYAFDAPLPIPSGLAITQVDLRLVVTDAPLDDAPDEPPFPVQVLPKSFAQGAARLGDLPITIPAPDLAPINIYPTVITTWEHAFRRNIPGVAEQWYHCVPGSTARSLAWMNETYCLGLPDDCDEAQEIYDVLKVLMNTTKANGTEYGVPDGEGGWTADGADALEGLRAFIEDKNLEGCLIPDARVFVEQDEDDPELTPCDLFERMQSGYDVMIWMGDWNDEDSTTLSDRNFGHAVTAAAMMKCGEQVTVTYRDDSAGDDNQGNPDNAGKDNDTEPDAETNKVEDFETGGASGWTFNDMRWEGGMWICPTPLKQLEAIAKRLFGAPDNPGDSILGRLIASLGGPPPTPDEVVEIFAWIEHVRDIANYLEAHLEQLGKDDAQVAAAAQLRELLTPALSAVESYLATEDPALLLEAIAALQDPAIAALIEQLTEARDCNGNGVDDMIDLMNGTSVDDDGDGVPDECRTPPCPADFDGDGFVNAADLAQLLAAWGTDDAAADLTDDGVVNAADLAELLAAWGPCPEG